MIIRLCKCCRKGYNEDTPDAIRFIEANEPDFICNKCDFELRLFAYEEHLLSLCMSEKEGGFAGSLLLTDPLDEKSDGVLIAGGHKFTVERYTIGEDSPL